VQPEPAQPAPAAPTEPTERIRQNSIALELAFVYKTLSGTDFNDSNVFIYQQPGYVAEGVAIPKLGGGPGFSLAVNYGDYPAAVGAVALWIGVRYSATWLAPHSAHTAVPLRRAVLHEVEFPAAIGFRLSRHVIPYLEASVSIGFQDVPNVHGIVDGDHLIFDSDSALFVSKSFGMGIGSLFCSNDLLCANAFVGYRGFVVGTINGAGVPDDLSAGGWVLRVGPTVLF